MKHSLEELRAVLRYEPDSGKFFWVVRVGPNGLAGREAGSKKTSWGYLVINHRGGRYLGHRLAWLFVYGKWPDQILDHIDGDPVNNRISNLRECNDFLNQGNRTRMNRNNTLGFRGITYVKQTGRYNAYLSEKYLGAFDTPEEASAAYEAESVARYGEFSYVHHRRRA